MIDDAERDVIEIYEYIARSESIEKAEYVLNEIEQACQGLKEQSNRGHYPPELERIGIKEYREIHFKSYRIIYNIKDNDFYIHCILDGRRDLQELLQKRVLR
jgi:toxin ParE1/3/4